MNYSFRPIATWPRKLTGGRKYSPFDSTYNQTMDLLFFELGKLRARDVIIQLALSSSDLRLDGLPRAGANPTHPGVILTFDKYVGDAKYLPLSFPCDAFTEWQANLRAIALSLEALRRVDRYGVTSHQEQYTGWSSLPPAGSVTGEMSVEEAAAIVGNVGGPVPFHAVLRSVGTFQACYRLAVKKLHPDAGGDVDDIDGWHRVQEAAKILKQHHGIA